MFPPAKDAVVPHLQEFRPAAGHLGMRMLRHMSAQLGPALSEGVTVQGDAGASQLTLRWPGGEFATLEASPDGYAVRHSALAGQGPARLEADYRGHDARIEVATVAHALSTPEGAMNAFRAGIEAVCERVQLQQLVVEGLMPALVSARRALARKLDGDQLPVIGGRSGTPVSLGLFIVDIAREQAWGGRVIADFGPWRAVALGNAPLVGLVHESLRGVRYTEPGDMLAMQRFPNFDDAPSYRARPLDEDAHKAWLARTYVAHSTSNLSAELMSHTVNRFGIAFQKTNPDVIAYQDAWLVERLHWKHMPSPLRRSVAALFATHPRPLGEEHEVMQMPCGPAAPERARTRTLVR